MGNSVESKLSELGLSGLEAEVFLAVLEEPGSTGYRISQVLGKAAPNTYKALNSLVVKGAVLLDEGDGSKTYTAVSVAELASQMKKRISSVAEEIACDLKRVYRRKKQTGLYTLNSIPQVLARAEVMITQAVSSIVVDGDVSPLSILQPLLSAAAARGVKVLVHGREPMEIPGCEYISSVSEGWKGDLLVLITDRQEYLLSFMTAGMEVLEMAVWSSNFVAACMYRSYLGKAMFYRVAMLINDPDSTKDSIRQEMKRLWDTMGYGDQDGGALSDLLS